MPETMTPEILGSARSTYTWAVRMVCEKKGIEYRLTETMLGAPELRAIHPLGKMPVLRHGAVELFESKAIATYLDRRFDGPQLLPVDPHSGALAEQWISLVNTSVDRILIRSYLYHYIVAMNASAKPDRAAIDAVMPAVRKKVAMLDEAVAASGHLVGDHFTFADINLLPILYRFRQAPEGAETLAAASHLAAYYERHATRPAFVRTIPPVGITGRAKPG